MGSRSSTRTRASSISPDVPIHLWHGAEDTEVPVAHVERLAAALPNADLHVFPAKGTSA